MNQNKLDKAIAKGQRYGVNEFEVKQILAAAGVDLPHKNQTVTIEIEVDLPAGRALYPNNLDISEHNGIPVKVVVGNNDPLLSN